MIGVFDSGQEGLSVPAAIAHALPCCDTDNSFIRNRVLKIGHHLVT